MAAQLNTLDKDVAWKKKKAKDKQTKNPRTKLEGMWRDTQSITELRPSPVI